MRTPEIGIWVILGTVMVMSTTAYLDGYMHKEAADQQGLPKALLVRLAQTAMGEGGVGSRGGQEAVLWALKNRLADPGKRYGKTLQDIIHRPKQFQFIDDPAIRKTRHFKDIMQMRSGDPRMQAAMRAVARVFYGAGMDPTKGATHFYSGKAEPSWARGKPSVSVGGQRFLSAE